jgi:hypothetical protein
MPANFPAKCTETRRAKSVDIDRELREFGMPETMRRLDDRVKPAVALMAYDPERMTASEYAWLAGE